MGSGLEELEKRYIVNNNIACLQQDDCFTFYSDDAEKVIATVHTDYKYSDFKIDKINDKITVIKYCKNKVLVLFNEEIKFEKYENVAEARWYSDCYKISYSKDYRLLERKFYNKKDRMSTREIEGARAILKMIYNEIRCMTRYLWVCNYKCVIDIRNMEIIIEDNGEILHFDNISHQISAVKQGNKAIIIDNYKEVKVCEIDTTYTLRDLSFGLMTVDDYTTIRFSRDKLIAINKYTNKVETYENVIKTEFKNGDYIIRYSRNNEILEKTIVIKDNHR